MLEEWPDEADRPLVTSPDEPRAGHANQTLLRQVHEHLRAELATIVEALGELALGAGGVDHQSAAGDVRAMIQRLTSRQERYSLGAFCAAYCRVLATHHAIEDQRLFPDIGAAEPALVPVLERLSAEHEVISELLLRLDEAVVALVADQTMVAATSAAADRLAEVLRSHLGYEEEQLLGPLGRLPVGI